MNIGSDANGTKPQFRAEYSVKVPNAAKNGEVVEFFVETLKVGDERAIVVIRVYDDFAWLLHCLKTQDNVVGVIFPPLPTAPVTSIQAAEKQTRKQVGKKATVLIGDNYEEDCKAYEKFLALCVSHPRLGESKIIQKFLCEKEAPSRVKLKKGILGGLFTKAVDDLRLLNFRDSNEEFHQLRISNIDNIRNMKDASTKYQRIVDTEHRMSSMYTSIQQSAGTIPSIDKCSENISKFTKVLSEACEHAAEMSKVLAINRRRTVNATLKLYAGYTDEEHDMLHKRVFKQLELDNAKKNFEKAKPPKKQQAEETIKRLDRELSNMTSLAKPELERQNRQRVLAWQSALLKMVESEIKTARDGLAVFTKQYAELQKLEI